MNRAITDRQSQHGESRKDAPAGTGSHAGDRVLVNKERILSSWEQRVRKQVAAAEREPHPILVNTLPAILEQLAEALSPNHPRRTATDGSTAAQEHGGERVRLTHFRLEDLIAEYKILREVLFEVLEEHASLTATERQTLNNSLDQMLIEACTGYALVQSRFRDQFFATVAHDLRNPLSAAQSSAALIAADPRAERVPQWATRIVENIRRVDRMLQDLLNAMSVQTGARLLLELDNCDLVDIVRTALELVQPEHAERFVLVAPDPVRGFFGRDALRRAVENLVINALKYGAPSWPITVAVRQSHERAIVTVHNHGNHIPAEEQETLFRAFQRLSGAEAGSKSGWGLGLAQARAVAEAHGGSIAVDSLPERGTTFILDIPADARPYQNKPITPGSRDSV